MSEMECPVGNDASQIQLRVHPIKLQFLHIRRLEFSTDILPESLKPDDLKAAAGGRWTVDISADVGTANAVVIASVDCCPAPKAATENKGTEEDEETEPGKSSAEPLYRLRMAAVAGFAFDPAEIQIAEVKQWCTLGSFYIIAPYLRNLIAQITRESGFREVILPMLEVPILQRKDRDADATESGEQACTTHKPRSDTPREHSSQL